MDILNTSTENERQIIQRTKPWGSSKGIQVTSSSMPANPAFRMEGSKLPVNLPKLVQQTPRLVVKKPWLVATKKEGQNNRRHLLRPENDPIFRTTIWTSHGLEKTWKYMEISILQERIHGHTDLHLTWHQYAPVRKATSQLATYALTIFIMFLPYTDYYTNDHKCSSPQIDRHS